MAHLVITSILPAFILGAILGRRYSVLVLVPVGFFVVVFVAVIATALSASFWTYLIGAVAGLSCLQLGYVASVAVGRFNEQPYRASHTSLKRYGGGQ
jgi:hypothetical protein